MSGRVVLKIPQAPPLKPSEPTRADADLLQRITDQLNQLNTVALAGVKSMTRPVPTQQAEAWDFEIIRGSDGRIKRVKATRL